MSKPINDDPMEFLSRAFIGGSSHAIESQEAQGQTELVNSDVLPTKISEDGKERLEAAGVVFGKICDGDELFQDVTLPEGWEKQPTEHSMWSELIDDKGKKRASIFYKAAFYDRKAFMQID